MYRIIVLLIVSLGLIACRGNDKVVSAWEINDVYQSTIVSSNPSTGGKTYQGPPINTMDAANTFEMFSLRAEKSTQGAKTYELLVHLTYFSPWRYYESANLLNKPASTFKVVSREAGICEAQLVQGPEAVEADGDVVQVQGHALGEIGQADAGDAAVAGVAAAAFGAAPALLLGGIGSATLSALFHQVGRHALLSLARRSRPMMPFGRNSVTAMNNAPRK